MWKVFQNLLKSFLRGGILNGAVTREMRAGLHLTGFFIRIDVLID